MKVTDEYAAWFRALLKEDLDSAIQVAQAVAALREEGPTLGRPLVDRLKGSSLHHLKELRPGSRGRSEIRIIFAFDPTRAALLLLGGDKAGNWNRWYKENIPLAIRLYIDYTSDEEELSCRRGRRGTGPTSSGNCTRPASPPP
ncbi:type II toxin-antitoxin system RelE/ParE family toxin [Microbispora rosea]|uniref:type II toxin-antitoxin system RelE/ParE family toxin n=1 Tax=Microbispora rosea TaxID=58117 RepID=UPI00341EEEFC